MDYKEIHSDFYDTYSREFDNRTWRDADRLNHYVSDFLSNVERGFRVLDLGSGPGKCSEVMRKRGYRVVSLDLSRNMLRICRERNPVVVQADLEELPFPYHAFHGIFASTSLIHMPKSNLPKVLENIRDSLSTLGLFYPIVKEGKGEGWVESDKYPGKKRYFAHYQKDEFEEYLTNAGFYDIWDSWIDTVGNATFLGWKCRT